MSYFRHGGYYTTEYRVWQGMKARCFNHNHTYYHRYGGRGITVCKRWKNSFENFRADMGKRPPGTTLDRINNDGNYEPNNCQWSTMREQHRNRHGNRFLEFHGERHTVAEWGEITGIRANTIVNRLNLHGWSVERSLTERP